MIKGDGKMTAIFIKIKLNNLMNIALSLSEIMKIIHIIMEYIYINSK